MVPSLILSEVFGHFGIGLTFSNRSMPISCSILGLPCIYTAFASCSRDPRWNKIFNFAKVRPRARPRALENVQR